MRTAPSICPGREGRELTALYGFDFVLLFGDVLHRRLDRKTAMIKRRLNRIQPISYGPSQTIVFFRHFYWIYGETYARI